MNYSEDVVNLSALKPCPQATALSASAQWSVLVINSVIVISSTLGLIGNSITGIVLSMPQMRSSYSLLLIALTLSDSIQLLCYIMFVGSQILRDFKIILSPESISPTFSKLSSMAVYVAYTTSAYFTVLLSFERYIAIRKPFKALKIFPTKRRSFLYSLVVVTAAIAFNLPKWLETDVCQERVKVETVFDDYSSNATVREVYRLGEIRVVYNDIFWNPLYRRVYMFLANFIVNFVIPLFTLIILNVMIYIGMRAANRRQQLLTAGQINDNSITVMLIAVVAVFCACHMWFAVKVLLQDLCGPACFPKVHVQITNFLYAFNASINFIIYCVWGTKFRQQLGLLFRGCCGCWGWRRSDCIHHQANKSPSLTPSMSHWVYNNRGSSKLGATEVELCQV